MRKSNNQFAEAAMSWTQDPLQCFSHQQDFCYRLTNAL
jgi:hypothetical protein